jgi:hypothetical protein
MKKVMNYFLVQSLTEVHILRRPAVALGQPPRLISINRGGYFMLPASVKH